MFDGHMQHDAQEFLRCLQCYLQDAEKEVQKFSCQLPKKMSPKIHVSSFIMNFLNLTKVKQELGENGVSVKPDSSQDNTVDISAIHNRADKAKVNLFCKLEDKETTEDPITANGPLIADTALVVDEIRDNAILPSASLESSIPIDEENYNTVDVSKGTDDSRKQLSKTRGRGRGRGRSVFRGGKSSKLINTEKKETESANGVGQNFEVKGQISSLGLKTYSARDKRRLGMRGGIAARSSEKMFDEIQAADNIKDEEKCVENGHTSDSSLKAVDSKTDKKNLVDEKDSLDRLTKQGSNDVEMGKEAMTKCKGNSYQNMFHAFLQHVAESGKASDGSQSDSDGEDIVLQKKRAKLLHESPRRSPRKNPSESAHTAQGSAGIVKPSTSDSAVKSVASKLCFDTTTSVAGVVSENVNHNSVIEKKENKSAEKSDLKMQESFNSDINEGDAQTATIDASEVKSDRKSISLVPVVKLENCDHVLAENGLSASASYACQVLTPVKRDPLYDSNNYMKLRSSSLMNIQDEEEFKKALEEMFNSPVKSRSKFDLVERQFQVRLYDYIKLCS